LGRQRLGRQRFGAHNETAVMFQAEGLRRS
jgi:hypothetical protein